MVRITDIAMDPELDLSVSRIIRAPRAAVW